MSPTKLSSLQIHFSILFCYLIKKLPSHHRNSQRLRSERQEKCVLMRKIFLHFSVFLFPSRTPVNFPRCLNLVRRRHRNASLRFLFSHYDDKTFSTFFATWVGEDSKKKKKRHGNLQQTLHCIVSHKQGQSAFIRALNIFPRVIQLTTEAPISMSSF